MADFQLAHSQTLRRTVRKTQWVASGVTLMLALVFGLLLSSAVVIVVAFTGGMIAVLGTPRAVRLNMRKQLRAMFAESFPPGTDTMTRLDARDDGLGTESVRGTGILSWSAFVALDESPTHIYLRLGGASGIVIPKERISEGDATAFQGELRSRLAAAAA